MREYTMNAEDLAEMMQDTISLFPLGTPACHIDALKGIAIRTCKWIPRGKAAVMQDGQCLGVVDITGDLRIANKNRN